MFLVAGLHSDNSVLTPDQQEEIEEAALALLRIFQNLKPFLRYLLSNVVASNVKNGSIWIEKLSYKNFFERSSYSCKMNPRCSNAIQTRCWFRLIARVHHGDYPGLISVLQLFGPGFRWAQHNNKFQLVFLELSGFASVDFSIRLSEFALTFRNEYYVILDRIDILRSADVCQNPIVYL